MTSRGAYSGVGGTQLLKVLLITNNISTEILTKYSCPRFSGLRPELILQKSEIAIDFKDFQKR